MARRLPAILALVGLAPPRLVGCKPCRYGDAWEFLQPCTLTPSPAQAGRRRRSAKLCNRGRFPGEELNRPGFPGGSNL